MLKPYPDIGIDPKTTLQEVIIVKQSIDLFSNVNNSVMSLDTCRLPTSIISADIEKALDYSNYSYKYKARIYSELYSVREAFNKLSEKYSLIPLTNLLNEAGLFIDDYKPTDFMIQKELASMLTFPDDSGRRPMYLITAKGYYVLDHILYCLTSNLLYNLF